MRSMTGWRRGDVVLVPIDFTDRSGTKRRPGVIVSSDEYNAESPDVMIASITGNLHVLRHPGDRAIRDWEAAGLLRPSLVQAKIATVETSILGRRLGRLDIEDLAALDRGLREALNLP